MRGFFAFLLLAACSEQIETELPPIRPCEALEALAREREFATKPQANSCNTLRIRMVA